jgi:hypothetical protein
MCLLITLIRRFRGDWAGLVWIDPLSVKLTVNTRDRTLKRNDMWHLGGVSEGDWDMNGAPVQEYGHIYSILKQRIENNMEYDAIPEFRENLELIRKGERPENCSNEAEYRMKWQNTETTYKTIKSQGYKTQRELRAVRPLNEIRIQIGRDGDLLFEEGIHRLAIAQLLKLESVPVIITRRHSEWVQKNRSLDTRQNSKLRFIWILISALFIDYTALSILSNQLG